MRQALCAVWVASCLLWSAGCENVGPGFVEPPGFDPSSGGPASGLSGGSARAAAARANGGKLQDEMAMFSAAGEVSSSNFRGRLMVGPVQPVANASSADHSVSLIPGAIVER